MGFGTMIEDMTHAASGAVRMVSTVAATAWVWAVANGDTGTL